MKQLLFFSLVIMLASCKPRYQTINGNYYAKNNSGIKLTLLPDNKFTFLQENTISALLSNEYYVESMGKWSLLADHKLLLESDSLTRPAYKIYEYKSVSEQSSRFTFLNHSNDTLGISLYTLNGKIFGRTHGTTSYVITTIQKGDTLSFTFPGYQTFTFVKSDTNNLDYSITLFPAYNGGYFNKTTFIVRRKYLIHPSSRLKFHKKGD